MTEFVVRVSRWMLAFYTLAGFAISIFSLWALEIFGTIPANYAPQNVIFEGGFSLRCAGPRLWGTQLGCAGRLRYFASDHREYYGAGGPTSLSRGPRYPQSLLTKLDTIATSSSN